MKRIILTIAITVPLTVGIFWAGLQYGVAQTPTPGNCGMVTSGTQTQVLQFQDMNCFAVPPGPTAGTCWLAVVQGVLTYQCVDGTRVKVSTESYP